MNSDFLLFLRDLWMKRPWVIVVCVIGVIAFVIFVIDTHRHRKKIKKRTPQPHHHDRH